MQRGFGPAAFEPEREQRDKELTIGPATVIGLAVGLLGLCGICFVAGYAVGHRGQGEPGLAQPASTGPSAAQLFNSQAKPQATQNSFDSHAGAPAPDSAAPAETAGGGDSPAPAMEGGGVSPAPAVVQTSLPAQAASQSVPATVQTVQPALPQSGAWMVQIAAVSHAEDADVLLGALRKRGYVVSARRDPADNLLHVQVGPFASHTDAAEMRQRLLNDGYNAIIQP